MSEMRAIEDGTVMKPAKPARANALKRFGPIAVIALGLALGYAMGWHEYLSLDFLAEQRETLTAYVGQNYAMALVTFTLLYVLAVAFSFPAASVLTIFGGFLFGWWVAGIAVAFGATAGASILFLAARSAFGDFLREKVGGFGARLADGFREDAFSYLLVLRLAPFFPFFVINIAPALFGVKLRTYVAATFLGILPGCFAYAWLGQGIGSVLDAADRDGGPVSLKDLVTPEITIAFVALAVVAVIPAIVRKWRGNRARMRRD
ncbi:TVP38/TMEM64 family protein [Zhengella mangrovi]|uniref:TVP38/TMEM64 family membrane protein n=1 Tax=Zhengella mangrovi TaxID=1982044 RepID=A0A2G1QH24_9HYPH|nr:TVP38/TMEM64 family protein [Zhengella mangrovi]PHP64816.1 TVP38/TMEM64 family protein [Zhengella mangrovi]